MTKTCIEIVKMDIILFPVQLWVLHDNKDIEVLVCVQRRKWSLRRGELRELEKRILRGDLCSKTP